MEVPSFTLACQSDFVVLGMQHGEAYSTPIRIGSTLIAMSLTAAWGTREKMNRLRLFFAHWLSGLVMELLYMIEDMMVTVCWTGRNLEGFIKLIKYIELAASNMLAITNLAICVNLALIIMSHQTLARVKSISSPAMIFAFLAISMVVAAATIPFWGVTFLLGTSFFLTSANEGEAQFILVSFFYVEFVVGICMAAIVTWLLLFQMHEIKECWKLHARIRYYFGLTILGTAVNLGLGICGTIFVSVQQPEALLLIWSWIFRYVHIALDTIVLYGVLRESCIDTRGGDSANSSAASTGVRAANWRGRLSTVPEGMSSTSPDKCVESACV